jgi:PAS domain S-box-containing protein
MNIFEKDKSPTPKYPESYHLEERPGKYYTISQSSFGLLIIMALSIFVYEAMVMVFFSFLPPFPSWWIEALLDSTLLVALISPTLYFFLFRPLTQHIAQRERAEEKLKKAHDELERRVNKRTAELAKTNEDLKLEIKERKRAEVALRNSEARLHHLLTASPAVIYTSNPSDNYRATYISANIKAQLGYEQRDFTEDPNFWIDNIHPEDRQRVLAGLLSPLLERGQHVHEYWFKHKDGTYRWMRDEVREVYDQEGNPLELVGYWIDETPRKVAEEELKWEFTVNAALSALYKPLISPEASIESITSIILDQANGLTASEHGFVSSIDPTTGDHIGHTLSEMMGDQCKVSDEKKTIIFPIGDDGVYPGLWGHSLNTGETFFTNSPETHSSSTGIPEGHIPLTRFLSVPVMLGKELVGQIAVANKDDDYTQRDVKAVRRLAEFYALAIQRMRAEEALLKAHDNLERKVEKRTEKLVQSNKRLIREIQKHKQTEEELSQAKAMLQTVFDGISDPLVMLDNTLSIRMLNEAAQKFYQVTDNKNVIGKPCYEEMKGKSSPCEGCEVPRAILNGKRRRFERKGFMDPNRLEDVVVYPIKGKTGNGAGAILHIRDITDRKLFEKQIIQSEKLASLGVLVSSIAHEINNPNSFIMFNIPILREYLEGLIPIVDTYAEGHPDLDLFHMPYPEFRKDLFRLLNNVEHGSARINSVVANLREFSRGKDKREEKWIDLKSVIERALAMCEVKMTKTVRSFAKDIPEDLPHVYSDPYALEQILINLLLNAAQASEKKDSRVDLSVAVNDSWLDHTVIQVSDNGHGMDDKTKQHIFDPFFTSKLRADGTGLGLYVTHNLVEGLRGRVEVESELGEGSVFRIVLPDKERRKKKRD